VAGLNSDGELVIVIGPSPGTGGSDLECDASEEI
jgi:hypothetical protein